LWALAAVLAAATLAAALAAVAWPIEPFDADAADVAPAAGAAEDVRPPRPPLDAYAALWQRDLLGPLFDPKPVAVPAPPKPKPTVRLVGTVIERTVSYALLRDKGGAVRMASVGQAVDGHEVLEVTAASATIRFGGETYTLKVEAEEGSKR
jgi:hypothetical protein